MDIALLLGHSIEKTTVTRSYINRPSTEHLAACAEKLVTFLLEKAGVLGPAAQGEKRDAG